ncbi:MAG: hypothetical protein FWG68_03340, partial [Defluviitaleaceae bacterium]|nr:hypothetical protein [Defluviitaleaceae bacterium]
APTVAGRSLVCPPTNPPVVPPINPARRGDRPRSPVHPYKKLQLLNIFTKSQVKQPTAKCQHHLTVKKINKLSGVKGTRSLAGCGAAPHGFDFLTVDWH